MTCILILYHCLMYMHDRDLCERCLVENRHHHDGFLRGGDDGARRDNWGGHLPSEEVGKTDQPVGSAARAAAWFTPHDRRTGVEEKIADGCTPIATSEFSFGSSSYDSWVPGLF